MKRTEKGSCACDGEKRELSCCHRPPPSTPSRPASARTARRRKARRGMTSVASLVFLRITRRREAHEFEYSSAVTRTDINAAQLRMSHLDHLSMLWSSSSSSIHLQRAIITPQLNSRVSLLFARWRTPILPSSALPSTLPANGLPGTSSPPMRPRVISGTLSRSASSGVTGGLSRSPPTQQYPASPPSPTPDQTFRKRQTSPLASALTAEVKKFTQEHGD